MKRLAILFCFAFIFVFSIGCTNDGDAEINILSINDIQSDPLSFTGELRINGIVALFADDDFSVFGIMDTAELLFCKDLYCGAFTLPVKYVGGGAIPELADEVDITGSWSDFDGSIIFEATDIVVKRNIMPILTGGGS